MFFRVAHYGELAAECVNAYYKYGSALLEKAQAEADPLGNMPKKESETQQQESSDDKNTANGDSVVSSDPERQGSSSGAQEGTQSLKLFDSFPLRFLDSNAMSASWYHHAYPLVDEVKDSLLLCCSRLFDCSVF